MARRDRHEPLHGPPPVVGAGPQAASDRDVQVEHRPGPRGQDPRRRRALPRPARRGHRAQRRREDADPGPRPHPAHAADATRDRSSATPTTTPATARPACSPRSRSAAGRVTTDHRARHTGADFLAFMRRVSRAYPKRRVARRARQRVAPTRPPRSRPGWSGTRASPSTSRLPAPRG